MTDDGQAPRARFEIRRAGQLEVAMDRLLVTFAGGHQRGWQVERIDAFVGRPLPVVERPAVVEGDGGAMPDGAAWVLHGVTSNERYATRQEHDALAAIQPPP